MYSQIIDCLNSEFGMRNASKHIFFLLYCVFVNVCILSLIAEAIQYTSIFHVQAVLLTSRIVRLYIKIYIFLEFGNDHNHLFNINCELFLFVSFLLLLSHIQLQCLTSTILIFFNKNHYKNNCPCSSIDFVIHIKSSEQKNIYSNCKNAFSLCQQ